MPNETFYITTPIYYVNDVPHIGTAYCTIAADVMARFQRLLGRDVFFLTGTDENAIKVAQAAKSAGKEPQEFCDELAQRFKEVWRIFNISYNDFIRTTEPRHKRAVQKFIEQMNRHDPQAVYAGYYEGWYCVFEETFYAEEELREGKCPECGRDVQWVKEPSFYFRLSAYQQKLLAHYAQHRGFLQPDFRANEVVSFVEGGLRNVSISRASRWGIPFPLPHPDGSDNLVVYVWFDALINYLSGIGFGSDDPQDKAKFEKYWPADVHLVGKDIFTRFHTTLWPAMLMAAGLEVPKQVFGHGFWNVEGQKMSKSRGNVIEPVQLATELSQQAKCPHEIAVDAIRYFLFREVAFGQDGDFQRANLSARWNGDLANDLGNLVNRVLTLIARYLNGRIPPLVEWGGELRTLAQQVQETIARDIARFDYTQALISIWELVRAGNRFVDSQAPWRLAQEGQKEKLQKVLRELCDAIFSLTIFVSPFMPTVAKEMANQLGAAELVAKWQWKDASNWGGLPEGLAIGKPKPLFPRLEEPTFLSHESRITSHEEKGEKPMETISIKDFQKLDLRVVKCVGVRPVPGTDKLYALEVDMGTETRTVVAGIAQEFKPEEILGKLLVLVANLEPARIRGVVSQGMILAAGEEKALALVTLDRNAPPGTKVR